MDKKGPIIFVIAAAIVGIAISLAYVGMPGNNETPTPDRGSSDGDVFRVLPDSDPPKILDESLRVEKVIQGLSFPTSMAFLDSRNVLILQKNDGKVRLVSNGTLELDPVLELQVRSESERGLLGVAVADAGSAKTVFLYLTEDDGGEVRHRVYRYTWTGHDLADQKMILDLPGTPGPNHDGGKLALGPDGMLYAVIGDLNRDGMLQNFGNGPKPDDTSVILRVTHDGKAASGNRLSGGSDINDSLSRYHAYGIRNSFGMDFDPVTGILWDTENGPADYDEVNVVRAGFNSGWQKVMGPIERTSVSLDDLVQFEDSHYADPVFSWRDALGVTDIEFLDSEKLGSKYARNIFVGDINNGNLHYFTVNSERTGIAFDMAGLSDLVADNEQEVSAVALGTGFGGITDIETGPDGYLYVLSFDGNVYRIVPANKNS